MYAYPVNIYIHLSVHVDKALLNVHAARRKKACYFVCKDIIIITIFVSSNSIFAKLVSQTKNNLLLLIAQYLTVVGIYVLMFSSMLTGASNWPQKTKLVKHCHVLYEDWT